MELNDIEILPEAQRPTKKCHKCHSIYVTDTECESCGLQFRPHELGEPLGPRSFFTLKEEFEGQKNIFTKRKSMIFKIYRKKLILRFRALLEALEYSFDDLDSWNTFNFELLELARYLASSPQNKYLLNRILLEKRDHPQFFELNKVIQIGREAPLVEIDSYPFKKTIYFLCFLLLLVPICMFLNKFYFIA
ncbi:MAG: hypothetical protein DRQ88_05815 [Epsilonproteobacteria bacterium]|nr:MAG: hypothetical protein DRQ89_06950 [Campylobacterota bacterium]RLA66729.1 MAG: hypothetical protein DRQ88_05815 [Campylobacterota bacterium]